MRDCIEEEVLQSYVDGELSPEMAESVAAHLAVCSTCAEALEEVTNEMAIFSAAFEAELALEVPTVRLRERLDAAIAERNAPAFVTQEKQGWSLAGWFSSLTEIFKVSPQRAIAYASLIAVVAFAAIFAVVYSRRSISNGNQRQEVAGNNPPKAVTPTASPSVSPSPTPSGEDNGTGGANKGNSGGGVNNPSPTRQAPKKQSKPILVPQPDQLPRVEEANTNPKALPKPLPGEQNYLKAIDSLSTEIAASDATAMKPSLRAEYERNLAVIDQAIDSTRRSARNNPKDADAAQFLYSSYQSKLDLLSTVAEQVRPTIATR